MGLILPLCCVGNRLRTGAWKWIRFPAWLSQKYFDDFYDPFGNTTGYAGYFWVDNDIRKQVIEAQRSGRTLAPRIFKDEANKAGGR